MTDAKKVGIIILELLLMLTIIIVGTIVIQKVDKVITKQQILEQQLSDLLPLLEDSSLSSDSNLAIRRMTNSLNSIERFIRTTPLVECGNWNDKRQKERSVHTSDK
jgi:hypothetical protein